MYVAGAAGKLDKQAGGATVDVGRDAVARKAVNTSAGLTKLGCFGGGVLAKNQFWLDGLVRAFFQGDGCGLRLEALEKVNIVRQAGLDIFPRDRVVFAWYQARDAKIAILVSGTSVGAAQTLSGSIPLGQSVTSTPLIATPSLFLTVPDTSAAPGESRISRVPLTPEVRSSFVRVTSCCPNRIDFTYTPSGNAST